MFLDVRWMDKCVLFKLWVLSGIIKVVDYGKEEKEVKC